MIEYVEHIIKALGQPYIIGVMFTLGVVCVCKLFSWSPVNISVTITQKDRDL